MKPDVLSDEVTDDLIDRNSAHPLGIWIKLVKEAQRDADVEWYEKKYLIPDYEWNLEQARQDTAREIFEEIEGEMTSTIVGGEKVLEFTTMEAEWQSLKSKFGVKK